jgi:hypothetical protein
LVVNVGTMAATSGGILRIAGGGTNSGTVNASSGSEVVFLHNFTNSKTIAASAGGTANFTSGTIINGTGGLIVASGASAHVDLDGAHIFGGTLKTSGIGAVIETVSSSGGAVLDGSGSPVTNLGTVLVNDDSALTLVFADLRPRHQRRHAVRHQFRRRGCDYGRRRGQWRSP